MPRTGGTDAITPEQVRTVAALASLRLEDSELAEVGADLAGVLQHMQTLERFEPAAAHDDGDPAEVPADLRPDTGPAETLSRPPAEMAPAFESSLFLVPRVSWVETGEP